jgi:hypothetical protein
VTDHEPILGLSYLGSLLRMHACGNKGSAG